MIGEDEREVLPSLAFSVKGVADDREDGGLEIIEKEAVGD